MRKRSESLAVVCFRAEWNFADSELATTSCDQCTVLIKEFAGGKNAFVIAVGDPCYRSNRTVSNGAKQIDFKMSSQYEHIFYDRVCCEEGRIVEGFKIDGAMHGSGSVVEVGSNVDFNDCFFVIDMEFGFEERVDWSSVIHVLEFSIVFQVQRPIRVL